MKGKSAMPQRILPLIPRGATQIIGLFSVWRDDESWTYFLSTHPIYSHRPEDHRMFRMITSQLIESGGCRQIDIIRTFGISKSSVIRGVKNSETKVRRHFLSSIELGEVVKFLTPMYLSKLSVCLIKDIAETMRLKSLALNMTLFAKR